MKVWKSLVVVALCLSLVLGLISTGFSTERVVKGEQYNLSDYERLTGKKITKFNEAPQLADLVKQGKLPPVEERLPKEPVVIEPWEEIGQYGGTWRRAWLGLSDGAGPFKIAYEHLVRWNADGSDVVPNIVKSFEVSKDGRTFTFHLREGLKWSDGTPFTTDDVRFWFEDIILNKELTPTFPSWLTVEGKPCTFKVKDKYTFTVSFSKPNAIFPMQLAYFGGFVAPSHYLKQFHPKYTDPKKLEEMAKEAKFQFWYQLFGFKNNWLQNPELPSLWAWKLGSAPTATLMVLERNPYYWKIDPAGNQLPYIDRITHELVQDAEIINMKAVAGEIDMQMRHIKLQNYTLLMENRDKGNYRVLRWTTASGSDYMLMPNQNLKDPVLKKLFQDRRFRFALSLAINRQEINQLVFLGMGKPRQASLISASPYYDPLWEKAYAEYNPKKANQLLDEIGLSKRDKDGYRLRPDGKTLALTIEFAISPVASDAAELVKKYWEAIGIKVDIKQHERSLMYTKTLAGDFEVTTWGMDRAFQPLADPLYLVPYRQEIGTWGPLYALWYMTGGKGGEEPPGVVRQLQKIWDVIKVTTKPEERKRLVAQLTKIHRENIWMIGTVGESPALVVVKNNFRNVPEKLVSDDILRSPGNAYPQVFFFKK